MNEDLLQDTRDLRLRLMKTFQDHQAGRVSNAFVRAQALNAREILDTLKVEIMASRIGLKSFTPVSLDSVGVSLVEDERGPTA